MHNAIKIFCLSLILMSCNQNKGNQQNSNKLDYPKEKNKADSLSKAFLEDFKKRDSLSLIAFEKQKEELNKNRFHIEDFTLKYNGQFKPVIYFTLLNNSKTEEYKAFEVIFNVEEGYGLEKSFAKRYNRVIKSGKRFKSFVTLEENQKILSVALGDHITTDGELINTFSSMKIDGRIE